MTDITYRVEGDYLIPNIISNDDADETTEEIIGRYGMMMERKGVDEALKAADQMIWVQKVNVLKAMRRK